MKTCYFHQFHFGAVRFMPGTAIPKGVFNNCTVQYVYKYFMLCFCVRRQHQSTDDMLYDIPFLLSIVLNVLD